MTTAKTRPSLVFGVSLYGFTLTFFLVTDALAQPVQKLENIEITGSSIKGIAGESGLPVSIIKGEDLRQAGVTSIEEAVRRAPTLHEINQPENVAITTNVHDDPLLCPNGEISR